jgi:hypothetical protein
MEPIITSIVAVLGEYALDKGGEFLEEVGPKALDTAKEIFTTVLDRLRKDPKSEVVAEEFKEDPATYEKPLEKKLAQEFEADAEFATQLQVLLEQYEQAAKDHAESTGRVYQATVSGSGAVAHDGGVAAGPRGVAVGGNVQGGVTISGVRLDEIPFGNGEPDLDV